MTNIFPISWKNDFERGNAAIIFFFLISHNLKIIFLLNISRISSYSALDSFKIFKKNPSQYIQNFIKHYQKSHKISKSLFTIIFAKYFRISSKFFLYFPNFINIFLSCPKIPSQFARYFQKLLITSHNFFKTCLKFQENFI